MKQTEIITASIGELAEPLQRLGTDMTVGGILLKQVIPAMNVEALVHTQGRGFTKLVRLQRLFPEVARAYGATSFTTLETEPFIRETPWHLAPAETKRHASMRAWLHLQGDVTFSIARAQPTKPLSFGAFGVPETEVFERAVAMPVTFTPDEGDMFLFIDRGVPETTGSCSYHKVSANSATEPRLGIAADINLK